MAPCAKHVFLLTDETKLEATIRTAFDIARSGRPGPVVIDIPKDVQNWPKASSRAPALLPACAVTGAARRADARDNLRTDARISSSCSAAASAR